MDDLIEKVARAIDGQAFAAFDKYGRKTAARDHALRQARAAIAECFRLRDMKDAPRDGEFWAFDQSRNRWFQVRRFNAQDPSDRYPVVEPCSGRTFFPSGWLPLPEPPEQKKTPG